MINNFLWTKLEAMDTEDLWFQQDGATCHTALATMTLIHQRFEGRVISRGGNVDGPQRSCDITPLDYFLWGYFRSRVFTNKPESFDDLKVNIADIIQKIQTNSKD